MPRRIAAWPASAETSAVSSPDGIGIAFERSLPLLCQRYPCSMSLTVLAFLIPAPVQTIAAGRSRLESFPSRSLDLSPSLADPFFHVLFWKPVQILQALSCADDFLKGVMCGSRQLSKTYVCQAAVVFCTLEHFKRGGY